MQNKDRWCLIGMWEADKTWTVITRWFGINQSQVSRSIEKYMYCQTNEVINSPWSGRPRVLVRSAVRDPKAPCSEFRQQ